ncbi:hypothetical protein N665_0342s0002 [Sinapis alba]|nr:hypothetical protein N665_0342s0002 [Sinapis alba]
MAYIKNIDPGLTLFLFNYMIDHFMVSLRLLVKDSSTLIPKLGLSGGGARCGRSGGGASERT